MASEKRVSSVWSSHLRDEASKKRFEESLKYVLASEVVRRLQEILDREMESLDRSDFNPDEYSNPSWAFAQAHNNGRRAQLKWMKDLLSTRE